MKWFEQTVVYMYDMSTTYCKTIQQEHTEPKRWAAQACGVCSRGQHKCSTKVQPEHQCGNIQSLFQSLCVKNSACAMLSQVKGIERPQNESPGVHRFRSASFSGTPAYASAYVSMRQHWFLKGRGCSSHHASCEAPAVLCKTRKHLTWHCSQQRLSYSRNSAELEGEEKAEQSCDGLPWCRSCDKLDVEGHK